MAGSKPDENVYKKVFKFISDFSWKITNKQTKKVRTKQNENGNHSSRVPANVRIGKISSDRYRLPKMKWPNERKGMQNMEYLFVHFLFFFVSARDKANKCATAQYRTQNVSYIIKSVYAVRTN